MKYICGFVDFIIGLLIVFGYEDVSEALTGEWWYKDMETGEDLPMYSTPIERKSWQDLNNECSELNRICKQLKSQLQQRDKIIKEVRKYITYWHYRNDFRINSFTTGVEEKLFEILDKGE